MLQRLTMIALLTVGLAAAKNYNFSMYDTAKAGSVQLKPGDYKVKVDGSKITVMDSDGNRIDAKATLQPVEKKYDQTAVAMKKASDGNEIQYIELGGTKDKLVFQR
ncbi:MAG: hypothetical protein JST11_06520 [Acidobacteria bacterium]|nr:hypothetical protein [Acidobacteriota bacterium]